MKICKNCNSKIEDDALVCPYCGCVTKKGSKKQSAQQDSQIITSETGNGETPKKRKTWLWVLGWIFVFPVPLSILMLRSQKMNKAVKIVIIAVAWIVYLGLIFTVGRSGDSVKMTDTSITQKTTAETTDNNVVVPEPIRVESIALGEVKTDLIIGETVKVQTTIFPSDAEDKVLTWTSSDEAVARVDESGIVSAVGDGTATVKVTSSNGVAASFDVTVDGSKALMNVKTSERRDDDNNIGDEWDYDIEINGERASNTIAVGVGDTLSFSAKITESDENPDVGTGSTSHTVTEEDLTNGFEVSFDVYVMENGDRNRGKSAHFIVTYTFSPN